MAEKKDIRQMELDGELIPTDDPDYGIIIDTIWETMRLACE